MQFTIDEMKRADGDRVLEIYAAGVATGHATFETRTPGWEQWDLEHIKICRLVARAGGKVVAWAALSPVSRREVYAGVAEISIYVTPDARGKGVGDALLAALIETSEAHGFWTLQSSVFPENEASMRLHLKYGFRELGRRERIARRDGIWRDTVIFERRSKVVGID